MKASIDTTQRPERRLRRRQRVWLAGELRVGDKTLVTCRVENLDSAGAQVRLDSACLLPAELELVMPGADSSRNAVILWRRGGLVGLELRGG